VTQKERLVEILREKPYGHSSYEDFADYLLENAVIVPPCKVGNELYYIPFGKTIVKCFVYAVEYTENATTIKCSIWHKERTGLLHKQYVYFNDDDFCKTVFLSKEEAEKAISERSSR
jgi:hypothetical protein